jgi:hypothetical protein
VFIARGEGVPSTTRTRALTRRAKFVSSLRDSALFVGEYLPALPCWEWKRQALRPIARMGSTQRKRILRCAQDDNQEIPG